LRGLLERNGLSAAYISSATSFKYFVGYSYLATERPAALIVSAGGDVFFFGPVMERDHLFTQTQLVSQVFTYRDYPGDKHPMRLFAEWLRQLRLTNTRVGVDSASFYSSAWGYRGISLSELEPSIKFTAIGEELYSMRLVKSINEQELIRESVKWGAVGHRLLEKYTQPGLYDFEVAAKASLEASLEMKRTLGYGYKAKNWSMTPVHAGFRGQVGEHSAYPHSISIESPIQKGDVLGTGASADVDGYHSELERNLFVGKPSEKCIRYHGLMLKMQDVALAAIRPKGKCSDADKAVDGFARENGLNEYVLHHTGHAMGLEGHEAPFFDLGDNTQIEPGMVFSVEPGLYIPGLGGFRHSDTVLIKEDSVEILTKYPRDTDSLILS
jgi:Xaa-Pro dipeptidase